MVTILPIEIDEDLVREGLQLAIAERIRFAVKQLNGMADELTAGGIVDREKWHQAFARVVEARDTFEPVLDFAKGFDDQWPETADES